MALWRIMAYYLQGGTCPFLNWYRNQEISVQALFDATLDILRETEDWEDTKSFQPLKREHAGLGEIRFKLEERGREVRRFRPVGIWPPLMEREFILLVGCEKRPRAAYDPADAFIKALEYRRRLLDGEGDARDYQ